MSKMAFDMDVSQVQGRLSVRAYNLMIGLHLLYGIIVTVAMCIFLRRYMGGVYFAHPLVFVLGFFGVTMLGNHLASRGNYALALLGYSLTVFGFGSLLATIVPFYALSIILTAAVMTGGVLVVMTILSALMPNAFLSMGKALMIALLAVIVVSVLSIFFRIINPDLISLAVIFIFSLMIGYDWAKGQRLPRTAAFAVYTALSLYMDVINIFVRILSLGGKRNS